MVIFLIEGCLGFHMQGKNNFNDLIDLIVDFNIDNVDINEVSKNLTNEFDITKETAESVLYLLDDNVKSFKKSLVNILKITKAIKQVGDFNVGCKCQFK